MIELKWASSTQHNLSILILTLWRPETPKQANILSGFVLFAKTKSIIRDRINTIFFGNYNLWPLNIYRWTIPTLLYVALWKIPLVWIGLSNLSFILMHWQAEKLISNGARNMMTLCTTENQDSGLDTFTREGCLVHPTMQWREKINRITIYSIIRPFDTFDIQHIWKYYGKWSICLESKCSISIIFSKVLKTLLKYFFLFCAILSKNKNDVMI